MVANFDLQASNLIGVLKDAALTADDAMVPALELTVVLKEAIALSKSPDTAFLYISPDMVERAYDAIASFGQPEHPYGFARTPTQDPFMAEIAKVINPHYKLALRALEIEERRALLENLTANSPRKAFGSRGEFLETVCAP